MTGSDTGAPAVTYVNADGSVYVPPSGLVSVTATRPALPAGATTVAHESVAAVTVAGVPPTRTVAPARKSDPLMVMVVPPVVGPLDGVRLVIVGDESVGQVSKSRPRTSFEYPLCALAELNARTAK